MAVRADNTGSPPIASSKPTSARGPKVVQRQGVRPSNTCAINVRAGLHCGPLVTGEMGSVKKEIVFLGDTVNTAARIQDLCRQTGDRVLASADLIDRLELPPGVAKRSLGDLRLRGKGADLALYALTRAPQRAHRAEATVSRDAAPEETRVALP
jgi:class 3 adenylate cyclase